VVLDNFLPVSDLLFLIFSIQVFFFIIFSLSHCYFHNITTTSN
jgi:hypothetical protein